MAGLKAIVAVLTISMVMASCNDYQDDNHKETITVTHHLSLRLPLHLREAVLTETKAVLTNVQTQQQYTTEKFTFSDSSFVTDLSLPEGYYNIVVTGTLTYQVNQQPITAKVKAKRENVPISNQEQKQTTEMALNVYSAQEGFVISEIFFTGTITPDGFMYTDDQYVKIGNNSDTTMYADGLAFIESFFTSDDKHDYQPNIMSEAMTISAIYVVPGTGRDVPVHPGEELVIALTAIDHSGINPNSFDLSKANFEIYDKSSTLDGDRDNLKVPNLTNWYGNFNGTFVMHTRGVKSYAIARPMVDMQTFMQKYRYKFEYIFKQGDIVVPIREREYFIPNAWIADAVNLAIPTAHEWNVLSPMLDKGFTYCANVNFDETRYNKSVVRKKEGKKWVDTNNSTEDFEPRATPSMLKYKLSQK